MDPNQATDQYWDGMGMNLGSDAAMVEGLLWMWNPPGAETQYATQ